MKKANGESRLHLFEDTEVLRATGRNSTGEAKAICGGFTDTGPFTALRDDVEDIDNLCGNCKNAIEE